MNKTKWFVLIDEEIVGPMESSEVEKFSKGKQEALVWGPNLKQWTRVDSWKQMLLNRGHEALSPKTVEATWRLRIEGRETSLMKLEEMIDYLKTLKDLNNIEVWTTEVKKWKDLYTVDTVVEALGVTRRAHPRVPIMGTLHCESHGLGNFQLKIITISEGGMGVLDAKNIRIGDRFRARLESPNMPSEISAQAEVLYVGKEGYAGLKFVGLSTIDKNQIIHYVNRFEQE